MSRWELRGALTALVTPFTDSGAVDETAFRDLARRQVAAGIDGLVPCGTTGETPTLTDAEWESLVGIAVEVAAGRIPVVAGTGTNDTGFSVRRTRRAAELGADAALVVVPYYNKPNRSGLERHYRSVADEGGLPVVLYNVPGRTGRSLAADELVQLAGLPGIAAVKEASGDVALTGRLLADRPREVRILSGDDVLTLPAMALGADGVISVVANEDPVRMHRLCDAMAAGRLEVARRAHEELLPLMEANFIESNPVPVKEALAMMGLLRPVFRSPLGRAAPETREALRRVLAGLGLVGETS